MPVRIKRRTPRVATWFATLFLLSVACASAQGEDPAHGVLDAEAATPQPRVRARDLARVLGAERGGEAGVLVLRREGVTLTMFDGSSDAIIGGGGAEQATLSAPARRREDGWWLPLDAGAPFGLVRTGPNAVRTADGRRWRLRVREPPAAATSSRARVVRAAAGASAVEIVSDGPQGQPEAVSLWVTDLALAALVVPEARAELDAAMAEVGASRGLLGVVTSRVPGARAEGPTVVVEGEVRVEAGARLQTLAGRRDAIGPAQPWTFVLWLPAGTRLDGPITVAWRDERADVVFRR
ncbi:MAG: hypothetical protein U5K81_11270 [Trueperaceae bacterium]|nr:hypothetical protein [Trueperaceae bacterium]